MLFSCLPRSRYMYVFIHSHAKKELTRLQGFCWLLIIAILHKMEFIWMIFFIFKTITSCRKKQGYESNLQSYKVCLTFTCLIKYLHYYIRICNGTHYISPIFLRHIITDPMFKTICKTDGIYLYNKIIEVFKLGIVSKAVRIGSI